MPVTFTKTSLEGVLIVESPRFHDERGFFTEAYSRKTWAEQGFGETFVQDNMSLSAKGVLRGMHYQIEPHAMGKLVQAVHGAVYDVAVDLRRGSPTFGKWTGQELSAENGLALWVPPGFAHGFLALDDETLVCYKCTAFYAPESERSLAYNDPEVGIEWPMAPAVVSDKDRAAPPLAEADFNFVF